jgi:DNA modification methylase
MSTYLVAHLQFSPIVYFLWLIKLFAKENGTILDPFLGSGTTLIVAKPSFNFNE